MYSKLNENRQYLIERDSIVLGADGNPLQVPDEPTKTKKSTTSKPKDTEKIAGSIFTRSQLEQVGKDRNKISDLLESGAVKDFPDFKNYSTTFKNVFIDSILDNSAYITQNPFLNYAKQARKTDIVKLGTSAYDGLVMLKNLLNNDALDIKLKNNSYSFMLNPKSFDADDPEYKIKALSFLAGPNAKNYGDLQTINDLMDRIVNSTKKDDIMLLVSNWQTKNGNGKNSGSGNRTNNRESNKKATDREAQRLIQQATNKMGSKLIVSRKQIEDYIANNATTSDNVYSAVGKAIMSVLNSTNN